MTLKDVLLAATATTQGDKFAIAEPFPDVTFIAALWAHNGSNNPRLRVRGYRFDDHRNVVEAWDVEQPEEMTIPFRPLAR